MKRKALLVFIILFFISIILYWKFVSWGNVLQIQNIAQKQTISLIEKNKPKSVYAISILITGHIDGSATIQRFEEDKKIYEPTIIKGNVNLHLGGDWYSDKCLIVYEPSNVKSGELQIRYKFKTL